MSSNIRTARSLSTVAMLLFLTACGGRAVNKKTAQDLILQSQPQTLHKEDVLIDSVTQTNSRDAIIETHLRTAFRFEKIGGKWIVKEVRVGRGQWYSLEDIYRLLRETQVEATRKSLEQVAAAIAKYKDKNGKLPEFKDYISLSDALSPEYLNPLIRLDAWERPLIAFRLNSDTIRLVSMGPDGVLGSSDDIQLSRRF